VWRFDICSRVLLNTEGADGGFLWAKEAKCEEDELGREELFGSGHLFHLPATAAVFRPFHADSVQALKLVLVVEYEILGRDAVFARVWSSRVSNASIFNVNARKVPPFPKCAATSV
jgi:hypothetical protein